MASCLEKRRRTVWECVSMGVWERAILDFGFAILDYAPGAPNLKSKTAKPKSETLSHPHTPIPPHNSHPFASGTSRFYTTYIRQQ